MTSTELTIQRLLEADALRKPVLRSAIQALHLPRGSRGLDVGCGIGLQELLLANATGPEGQITGLDIDPGLLAYGEGLVRKAGLSKQVTFREGDMRSLPWPDATFDWAWSADCIGYPAADLPPILEELKRVVRPAGRIILLAWTAQQMLPGYPLLEARWNAACSSYLPYLSGKDPELHFLRAPRWLHEAGLVEIEAQTFVRDVQAPLSPEERAALAALFEMLWGEGASKASTQDRRQYRRLCDPHSPDFILDLAGYYAFFTYTMFRGTVPI